VGSGRGKGGKSKQKRPSIGQHVPPDDKRPTAGRFLPGSTKSPRSQGSPDVFLDLSPSWRVGKLQTAGNFGWHELGRDKILQILERLRSLESMTWSEILVKSSKHFHKVNIAQLSPPARKRFEELSLDDYEELLSTRLSARERIWGFLDQGILHLIWWDPEHQVCPSLKKHT
jgi:hypothetical protein